MKPNKYITIQHQTTPKDNWGDGPDEEWEELRKEWFLLSPLSGREYEREQKMEATTTHRGRCRYFEGADSKLRLVYGDRIFNVQSVVNEEERNKWLVWRLIEVT